MRSYPKLLVVAGLLFRSTVYGQLSTSAYRALGQPDLRQNGVNMVQGVELYAPAGIALDSRDGVVHLYVSDSRNNRVLAWQDTRSYQSGDAPALVLGQPTPQHSNPQGIGPKGFVTPLGLAVDPTNGNLYVADFGDNRVLRFPAPFANPSRVEPDAVYGQPNFTARTANTGGVTKTSLSAPRGLAFDSAGNLWVADSGNNRVLRFSAATLDSPLPEADLALGQKDLNSGAANRGGGAVSASGFDSPFGLTFDADNNLYVSDFTNTRVLKFSTPVAPDAAATAVFGEPDFTTRGVSPQPSATTLTGPAGIAIDNGGALYVSVPNDNRVMVFRAGVAAGSAARDVLGQVDFSGTQPNSSAFPYASANTLSNVFDVKLDPDGNVFVADSGNNRVLSFPRSLKSASQVWGQLDFTGNGVNRVKPGSINAPYKMAIDYSQSPYALYVSDTNNHRVLVWRDSARFQTGDGADLVIGQPDFSTALANVDTRGSQRPSRSSLSSPQGLAVDAAGNLYVADSGNHRVLRYPRPVDQPGRIQPDVVLGQADFTSSAAAAVNASSLRSPAGLAIGPDGNIFVADAGNNRVLEFPAGSSTRVAAIRVYGQPNFTTGAARPASSQTLLLPRGIFVDAGYTLYVADTGFNRVVIYAGTSSAPSAGAAASIVIGQDRFDTSNAGLLHTPLDVVVDSSGNVYVSDSGANRVLAFSSLIFLPLSGATPIGLLGQRDPTGSAANWNSTDGLATPEGLSSPLGLFFDRRDTLYVGDAGNNRVLHFLKPGVLIHAANLQSGTPLARGGLASFYGGGLSDTTEIAPAQYPLALAAREVVVNDQVRSPLGYVSPGQINLQIPSSAPLGPVRVAVRVADTAELIAGSTLSLAGASPGLFVTDSKGQGRIINADGTPNSAANPALKGSVIKVFGTGQGPVSPPVADGDAAPSDPPVNTVAVPTSDGATCLNRQPSVCVAIASSFGDIQFSGLAPGVVGEWQLSVKIPATAPSGSAVPLRAVINGALSNIVALAIR